MRNIKLTIAYDGTNFHGFQVQPNLRTVQGMLQETLEAAGLDDCERMSRALEERLDALDIIPDTYVLEISSPGISRQLTTDREFLSFKGYAVIVTTSEPYEGHKEWRGQLMGRDDTGVYLNQKGRAIAIPRELVTRVQLDNKV
jgi:ribosome maturation factor RimP